MVTKKVCECELLTGSTWASSEDMLPGYCVTVSLMKIFHLEGKFIKHKMLKGKSTLNFKTGCFQGGETTERPKVNKTFHPEEKLSKLRKLMASVSLRNYRIH